jgi:hypothetical protein
MDDMQGTGRMRRALVELKLGAKDAGWGGGEGG